MMAVFFVIYTIVHVSIMREIDSDLSIEAHKHIDEINFIDNQLHFINKEEMEEREHRESEVNPVFIQLYNENKIITDKSPNLKADSLLINLQETAGSAYNSSIHDKPVRQMHLNLEFNGDSMGYILAGMSMQGHAQTLRNLRNTLLILFPLVLIGLFLISRFLAGKSIQPLNEIIAKTNLITKNNLNQRVPLPKNKDELHQLSSAINELLIRIEKAMQREKQFTSDASHELRTPLAVLKGTLEVLLRKPRTEAEYKEKIQYSLLEIEHMSQLTEQLLTMARLDENQVITNQKSFEEILDNLIHRNQNAIQDKNLKIKIKHEVETFPKLKEHLTTLLIGNILSNAVKFSPEKGIIEIHTFYQDQTFVISISDQGPGINKTDIELIFNPFYRAQQTNNVKGSGLGLSIAKKAADLLQAKILYENITPKRSIFIVQFNSYM